MANAQYLNLLAEGWGDLIPFIFIVGVSVVSAIAKATNKGDENSKNEKEKTSRLIEMAKRYKEMQESGQQRTVPKEEIPYARTVKTPAERKPGTVSEWDRRQQQKKQQMARQREMPRRPKYVETETPPRFEPKTPEVIPVAAPVRQAEPVRPAYKTPKIQTKPRPKRASQRSQKRQQHIPVAQPVELPVVKEVKRPKPKKHKTTAAQMSLAELLKGKQSLRSAIILKEILDKPIGLRESF
ncbi:MAG: hypothetical protein ACYSUT_08020 [Planctomycetota bacterium]